MAKADDIQHYCHMVGAYADLHGVEVGRYVAVLEKIAREGGFITDKTEEAAKLKNTAEDLRGLADRIALVRESLLMNGRNHVGEVE